tara:strand:+ start:41149 stop:41982 length:834 start_codon:yes stop_codon:yes gene_type:complete
MESPAPAKPTTPDLRFIAQGASAMLYDRGDGHVLKIFRNSVSDEMIAREVAVSVHANTVGLPTAPALGRHDGEEGRAIVYPYLEGPTLMAWLRRHPVRAGWALEQMADLHRRISEAPAGQLRSLKQVLETDISYGPAPMAIKQSAIAYLRTLPDAPILTHGDFHLGNIMMTDAGLKVIDWSKAAAGHPAADAVRSEMLMRFGEGPDDAITNLWRDWAARHLARCYLTSSTFSASDMSMWRPVVALAWLRARQAGRAKSFHRYLNKAMAQVNISPILI